MTQRTIARDNGPDLVFDGDFVGTASSREFKSDRGLWTELLLYRTVTGQYVLVRERYVATPTGGRRQSATAVVFATSEALIKAEGWSPLSKRLYSRAGLSGGPERVE